MYAKPRLIFDLLVGRILSNVTMMIHSIQTLYENDTTGVGCVTFILGEGTHDCLSVQEKETGQKCNLGQQKGDLMDQKKLTC